MREQSRSDSVGNPVRGMLVMAAGAVALAATCAAQTGAAHPAARLERMLGGLGCDAAVMVDNAARQRQSAAGRALRSMLESSSAFPETSAAWRELAGALDWPVDTAFDELLGRRVTVVVRGVDGPGQPQWALLTEVSVQTERRLREKLQAAPRGTIEGLGVLSVEDGKYELVVGRATPGVDPGLAGVTGAPPPTAEVLLCPGDDCPLMTELAPALVSRSGLASPAPVWRAGQPERGADVQVLLRRKDGSAGERFLSVSATLEQNGWESRLACSPGLVLDRPAALEQVRPWADGSFRSMDGGSLAACMGVIGSVRWMPAWARLNALDSMMPVLQAGPCGQLAALVARPATGSAGRRAGREHQGPVFAADGRLASAPAVGAPVEENPPPPLCVTLAVESRQGCRAVSQGDEAVARLIAMLRTGDAEAAGDRPAVRFEVGVPESAVRTLGLSDFPMQESYSNAIRRCFGEEPVVTWGGIRGGMALASSRGARGGADWWFASISPSATGGGGREAAALLGPEIGAPIRRLTIGVLRPAELADYLERDDEDRGWMRWVDSIRWDAWLAADGNVQGTVSVRMVGGR